MAAVVGEVSFDCSFGQEAQQWLSTVYAAMERLPAGKLFALLKPGKTVEVVNQAKAFVHEVHPQPCSLHLPDQDQPMQPQQEQASQCHQLIQAAEFAPSERQLVCLSSLQAFKLLGNNKGDAASTQLQDNTQEEQEFHCGKCALYLYYRVLQGLLSSVTEKHTRSGAAVDSRVMSLASNQTLQLALLTCAVELTCYCTSGAATFPAVSSMLGQLPAAFDHWEACGLFLQYLAAETTTPLAESVASYLLFMRMKITEGMAWQTGSSLFQAICEGGGGSHMPGDYALVSSFLDSVAALARSRVNGCAAAMTAASKVPEGGAAFASDCEWLMHCVLQENLDLLFGQHLSNVVACCVYGIARAHGAAASFREITEALVRTFPHHTMQDFKQAELSPTTGNAEVQYGDTRQLYNRIFLPRMEGILQDRFPSMLQHDGQTDKAINKQVLKAKRAPLKALSATDMNTRLSRFHQMQG